MMEKIEKLLPEEELELSKEIEWEKRNEQIKKILKNGIAEYIKFLKINLEEGVEKEGVKRKLVCIDERIAGNGEITLAGAGILFSKEDLIKFIEDNKIKIIATHDNCGAAQKKYSDLTQKEADQKAKKYAQEIAKELNIKHEHISINNIEPKNFHNARTIYFNNVDKFNPAKIKNLPKGFVIEKFINIKNNAEKELKIAIEIALSYHGFGEKFTKENPLIIVCCLNKNDFPKKVMEENDKLLDEMQKNSQRGIKSIKEKIRIDYFVVPAKKE